MMKNEIPLRYLGQLSDNPIEVFKQVKEQQRQRLEEMRERKKEKEIECLIEDDNKVCNANGIGYVNPVGKDGCYVTGPWEGRLVTDPELEIDIIKYCS